MSYSDRERMICDTDIEQFDIEFEVIFDYPELLNVFKTYLKHDSSVDFLEDVARLKATKSTKMVSEISKHIYDTYITEQSARQVNLPHHITNAINTHTEECSDLSSNGSLIGSSMCSAGTSSTVIQSFVEAESHVIITLKEQHRVNFLNHTSFKEYLKTRKLSFLYEIGTLKTCSNIYYIETLGDLRSKHFNMRDFQFIRNLVHDDRDWLLVGSSDNHKCYLSTQCFDFGSSKGLQFYKFEVVFPFTVDECLKTLCSTEYRMKYDGNLSDVEVLEYINMTEDVNTYSSTGDMTLSSVVTRETYKMVWPFDNRDFIISSSGMRFEDGSCIICKKSCHHEKAGEPKKGTIRGEGIGGWMFYPLSQRATKYVQIFYIDFKGKIPKSVFTSVIKSRAKRFKKLGGACMEKHALKNFSNVDDAMMLQTIEHNTVK